MGTKKKKKGSIRHHYYTLRIEKWGELRGRFSTGQASTLGGAPTEGEGIGKYPLTDREWESWAFLMPNHSHSLFLFSNLVHTFITMASMWQQYKVRNKESVLHTGWRVYVFIRRMCSQSNILIWIRCPFSSHRPCLLAHACISDSVWKYQSQVPKQKTAGSSCRMLTLFAIFSSAQIL